MYLICGLGNPGVNYQNTRHNVGFYLADNIISHFNLDKIKEDKIKKLYSGKINNQKYIELKNHITHYIHTLMIIPLEM